MSTPYGWLLVAYLIALSIVIVLYVLIVRAMGTSVARWPVRLLRPFAMMVFMSPAIAIGHGIGFAPMFIILFAGSELPANQLLLNGVIWAIFSGAGFLAEIQIARHRSRRDAEARRALEQRDSAAALRLLTRDEEPRGR